MQTRHIRSFTDLEALASAGGSVLALASGGADSAYLLRRLTALFGERVTALHVDLGASESLGLLRNVCERLGCRLRVVDATAEFSEGYVAPAVRAQARYLGMYPISASLSRPLMAKVAVEVAAELQANILVHAATPSQNSLRRFNGALTDLGFPGAFGSPFEQTSVERGEKAVALAAAGFPEYQQRVHSVDQNLWCRSIEAGELDDPETDVAREELFRWTRRTRTDAEQLSIGFDRGRPDSVNGVKQELVPLLRGLNRLVGAFGLGRYVGLEETASGHKVQELREAPAAWILLEAYRCLETACVPAEAIREKQHQEQLWVREASEGRWFGVLRQAAESFIATVADRVSGVAHFELGLQGLRLVRLQVPKPLYVRSRAEIEGRSGTAPV
jgi:argininosuccinate synthase